MNIIEASKISAIQNMEMFLRNFSKVPDEKLQFKLAPGAKSPIRIAAHTALYAGRFAAMIRDRKLPSSENVDEWVAMCNSEEEALTDRAEMEKNFRAGTEAAIAAMDTFSEEEAEGTIDSGQGWSMSMRFLLALPGWHATLHMGQIDFLQTCWDDQEIYVG